MTLINKTAAYDETKGAVNSFLLGIARNQVLRRLRQERPTVPVDEHHEEIDNNVARRHFSHSIVRKEEIDAVRKAVLSLPEHYREVVILCELQEMSYAETAHVMNCAVGTVRSRLHRARAILPTALRKAMHRVTMLNPSPAGAVACPARKGKGRHGCAQHALSAAGLSPDKES